MKQAHAPAVDRPRAADSASRLVDAHPGLPKTSSAAQPTCAVCHWGVLAVRQFKGRLVCLACIAEHFAEDGEET
jgi:hypothetical protein